MLSVVQGHLEAPRECGEEFPQVLVCMTPPELPTRDVINPVGALDREWNVPSALDEAQVAPGIVDLGQLDETRVSDARKDDAVSPPSCAIRIAGLWDVQLIEAM